MCGGACALCVAAIYTLSGVYIGLLLFATGMPMPSRKKQIAVACISVVVAWAVNFLFIGTVPQHFNYLLPLVTVCVAVPFLIMIFQLQRQLTQMQDKAHRIALKKLQSSKNLLTIV